jgi:predicted nucleic acid-binding protein
LKHASAALMHRLTVVTRDVRDFESFGVQILNSFVTER